MVGGGGEDAVGGGVDGEGFDAGFVAVELEVGFEGGGERGGVFGVFPESDCAVEAGGCDLSR